MRRLAAGALAVLVVLVIRPAAGADSGGPEEARITYVTATTVYLDAGSAAGVRKGDVVKVFRDGEFVTALIGFNVGVELGQLAVIALAFLTVGLWCRHRRWYRRAVVIPGSAAIALVGAYWTLERVFS